MGVRFVAAVNILIVTSQEQDRYLVRVMKTSLHCTNTVEIGLAIGFSLQLLLFGACESLAQTKTLTQTNDLVDLAPLHNALNFGEQFAPREKVLLADAQLHSQATFNKEDYQPPKNGQPDRSRGTGTRCIRDSLDIILEGLL